MGAELYGGSDGLGQGSDDGKEEPGTDRCTQAADLDSGAIDVNGFMGRAQKH
jgi:hypothetical protein